MCRHALHSTCHSSHRLSRRTEAAEPPWGHAIVGDQQLVDLDDILLVENCRGSTN